MKYNFYESNEWRDLRYRVLKHYGGKCMLCHSEKKLHVDHIKPRSTHPELELEFTNMQVLCEDCNMGKSNRYEDDFRKPSVKPKLNPGKLSELISKIG